MEGLTFNARMNERSRTFFYTFNLGDKELFGRCKIVPIAYSPLNSANLSLISEVTLPRTVNASPPVAQTRVIFVSSLYYILGTGLFSLSLVLLHIYVSHLFLKKRPARP